MAKEAKTKHTQYLRAGDMDYIISATPKGKASYAIRKIVSDFVDKLKAQEKEQE